MVKRDISKLKSAREEGAIPHDLPDRFKRNKSPADFGEQSQRKTLPGLSPEPEEQAHLC